MGVARKVSCKILPQAVRRSQLENGLHAKRISLRIRDRFLVITFKHCNRQVELLKGLYQVISFSKPQFPDHRCSALNVRHILDPANTPSAPSRTGMKKGERLAKEEASRRELEEKREEAGATTAQAQALSDKNFWKYGTWLLRMQANISTRKFGHVMRHKVFSSTSPTMLDTNVSTVFRGWYQDLRLH